MSYMYIVYFVKYSWKLCTTNLNILWNIYEYSYKKWLAFRNQPFNSPFPKKYKHIERTRWQVSYQCWSLWGMDAVKWIDKCILLSDTINHSLFVWPVVIPNEPLIGHFVYFFQANRRGIKTVYTSDVYNVRVSWSITESFSV